METNIKELNERIQKESAFVDMINMEMHKVIIGQKHMIERLLIGLLSNGHILLEGVPGLAKTLAVTYWQKPLMRNSAVFNLLPTCYLPTYSEL